MSKSNKILIAVSILAILLIGFTWWRINSNNDADDSDQQSTQEGSESADNADNGNHPAEEEKKLAVSESELARLKSQGVVSSDEKYYIQNFAAGFPKIVSLETGEQYEFRPGKNYTKVSKVSWSGDGKALAYLYQVPDAGYANVDIFNTATIEEVVSQKFGNAARVLTTGGNMDYVWTGSDTVLYTSLQNYDSAKKYYGNGTVGTYNLKTEKFQVPWTVEDGFHVRYVDNLYSIEIAPSKDKFLYVQAVLNDDGSTNKRIYVTVDYHGNVLKTADAYDKNWYK